MSENIPTPLKHLEEIVVSTCTELFAPLKTSLKIVPKGEAQGYDVFVEVKGKKRKVALQSLIRSEEVNTLFSGVLSTTIVRRLEELIVQEGVKSMQ